jgi:hypothetical protein
MIVRQYSCAVSEGAHVRVEVGAEIVPYHDYQASRERAAVIKAAKPASDMAHQVLERSRCPSIERQSAPPPVSVPVPP